MKGNNRCGANASHAPKTRGRFGLLLLITAAVLIFPATASAGLVTVNLNGSGEGTVTSAPAGLNCGNPGGASPGPACNFTYGGFATVVNLTASPEDGSNFDGWSGATCAGGTPLSNPCTVVSTATPISIAATFNLALAAPEVAIVDVDPGEVTDSAAELNGTVNPTGSALTTCRFEWVKQSEPAGFNSPSVGTVPCQPDPGSVDEDVPVEATATGLEANTTYRVRLLAAKSATVLDSDEATPFETQPGAPTVETRPAASESAWRATLVGRVDPRNSDTRYFFELTPQGGEPSSVPAEPVLLEADEGGSLVTAEVTGLSPETEYTFRLIAYLDEDEALRSEGDTVAFTTRTAAESAAPARAFELVSPYFTNASPVQGQHLTADGGSALTFSLIPLADSENIGFDWRISRRNDDGSWSLSPHKAGAPIALNAATLDASPAPLVNDPMTFAAFGGVGRFDPGDTNTANDIYLRDMADGRLRWVSNSAAEPEAASDAMWISDDGSQVIFTSARKLLPTDLSTAPTLYEWKDGVLRQLAFRPGAINGPTQGSELGGGRGGASGALSHTGELRNAVSSDGNRVVFTIDGAGISRELYVNEGGEIIQVAPTSSHADYWGADTDVETVVYTQDGNLYSFALATETSKMVHPAVSGGAGVYRALHVSDDGNRIYFVATKDVLGAGDDANPYGLYVAERPDRASDFEVQYIGPVEDENGWQRGFTARHYGADPAGNVLAFRSSTQLVPGRPTGGTPQVYAYEHSRRQVYCLSCPADGSSPGGDWGALQLTASFDGRARTANWNPSNPAPRVVAEDGTVIFSTANRLDPRDVDAKRDVYEWHGGEVSLVSSGVSGFGDTLGGISADGQTILINSMATLVDGLPETSVMRAYAAVVGGGFKALDPPAADCAGAECRELTEPDRHPARSDSVRESRSRVNPAGSCRPQQRAVSRHRRLTRRAMAQFRRAKRHATRHKASAGTRRQLRKSRGRLKDARSSLARAKRELKKCRRAA